MASYGPRLIARMTAAGQSTGVDFRGSKGGTPYVVDREATFKIRFSSNFAGTVPKFQKSDDGGTTWTDMMSATEITNALADDIFEKDMPIPGMVRASLATITGGTATFTIEGRV